MTIVSGHAPLEERELAHLAGLGGTIVVLMGVTNLPHLAAGLARHGMAPGMPIAIIERGFSRQPAHHDRRHRHDRAGGQRASVPSHRRSS